jgi:TatD DNase family protein
MLEDIKYIDIHSHLNLSPLKENRDEVIARMFEMGVGTITIGVDFETSREAVELAENYDFIYAGVGLHPTDNTHEDFDFEKYKELSLNKKVVCIGECGLDYFRGVDEEIKNKQKTIFLKHVELAVATNKPLMIHARPSKNTMDAYEDVLDILKFFKEKHGDALRGNFHFFVGDKTIAQRALDLGFTMSFDGPITFVNDYDEVIEFLSIESIMIETDAPFAAPISHRGKVCEPFMVPEILKKIAQVKKMDEEEARRAILANVKRVFGI